MYDVMPQSGISQILAQMIGMGGVSMPITNPMAPSFQMPQIQGANPTGNSPHFTPMPAPQPPQQQQDPMGGGGPNIGLMAMMQGMQPKEPAMTGASASLPSGMPGVANLALEQAMPTLQHQNMLQHLFAGNGLLGSLFG